MNSQNVILLGGQFLCWPSDDAIKLLSMVQGVGQKLAQPFIQEIKLEQKVHHLKKTDSDDSLIVISGDEIGILKPSLKGDTLVVDEICKSRKLPKNIFKEASEILRVSSTQSGKYITVSLVGRQTLVQLVANIETGIFHQATYSYSLVNQMPLFNLHTTMLSAFEPLGWADTQGNPLYSVELMSYHKKKLLIDCVLSVISHKDLCVKSVFTVSICQDLQQIIPPLECLTQIPIQDMMIVDRKGKEVLLTNGEKLFAGTKMIFSSQSQILNVTCDQNTVIVLNKVELAIISTPDYKLLKKTQLSGYPDRIIGITKQVILIRDKIESILAYSSASLEFVRMLYLPHETLSSTMIKKYHDNQNPLNSYFMQCLGTKVLKVNSKQIIDFEDSQLLKVITLNQQLLLLTEQRLRLFSLTTNSYTSTFIIPSKFFKAITVKHLVQSGITLLLTVFNAYVDRTQDFLAQGLSDKQFQLLRLIGSIIFMKLSEVHLLIIPSMQQPEYLDIRLASTFDSPQAFKYIESQNMLALFNENQIEFYTFKIDAILASGEQQHTLNKSRFKYKQAGQIAGVSEDNTQDLLDLEHSEKQEMLRDKHNKVSREDIDILERFKALEIEKIRKILVSNDDSRITRLFVFTDASMMYVYQLQVSSNAQSGKTSLTVEELCLDTISDVYDFNQSSFRNINQNSFQSVGTIYTIIIIQQDEVLIESKNQVTQISLKREYDAKKQKFYIQIDKKPIGTGLNSSCSYIFIEKEKQAKILLEDRTTRKLKEISLIK